MCSGACASSSGCCRSITFETQWRFFPCVSGNIHLRLIFCLLPQALPFGTMFICIKYLVCLKVLLEDANFQGAQSLSVAHFSTISLPRTNHGSSIVILLVYSACRRYAFAAASQVSTSHSHNPPSHTHITPTLTRIPLSLTHMLSSLLIFCPLAGSSPVV